MLDRNQLASCIVRTRIVLKGLLNDSLRRGSWLFSRPGSAWSAIPLRTADDVSLHREPSLPFRLLVPHSRIHIAPMISRASPNFLAIACMASLEQEKDASESSQVIHDVCQQYYDGMILDSAADFFGLAHPANPALLHADPYCEAWPWQPVSLAAASAYYRQGIEREYRQYASNEMQIEYPWYYGQVSKKKIRFEASRLCSVMASITSRGYCFADSNDGDIVGWLMIDGPNWHVHVHSGLHRLATLTGLLYRVLPIRIQKVIYRDQIKTWPNVRSGLFTAAEADTVFQSCFTSHMACPEDSWYQDKLPNRYHDLGLL